MRLNGKYKFNPETLLYEKMKFTFRQKFFIALPFISFTCIIAVIIMFFGFNYLESPKLKRLIENQTEILFQFRLLKNELVKLEEIVEDIYYNDDHIYRTYFEVDPLSPSLREAGFGGHEVRNITSGLKFGNITGEISKTLTVLANRMVVQSQSYDEVIEMAKNKEKRLAARPAIQPVSINELTRFGSAFGIRLHPILQVVRMHEGIDLTCPRGTKVFATADGVVVASGYTSGGLGIRIFIDHGYGYKTIYGHLDKVLVKQGDRVKRGDVIGLVGSSGLSTCPHLHYEVIVNGRKVNPINYYANDLTPEEYDLMISFLSNADPSFDIN